ncbi:MAG TPA: glycoside hydrolase family 71/99-like protein [Chthonomonadaceae bacterium]|nr:glycoside hydrolase family 71/99-like protein [Chthonomonadaceae bacterium]
MSLSPNLVLSLLLLAWAHLPSCAVKAANVAHARQPDIATAKPSRNTRFLMAHYMPWFEAAPERHQWGWHWTMNHFRPEHQAAGRREVASHYYPLLGLYDSNDSDLLECHALLMKFAGIDGAIIDWYGNDNLLDYGLIHRNTQHLIQVLRRAGLHLAICYEDQTVPKLIAGHLFPASEAVAHGQKLLAWMQANWFVSPTYLKQDGRPVLLVFGGGYYQAEDWKRIFAPLPQPPDLFTELDRRAPAIGGFGWPVPEGGTEKSFVELNSFYTRAKAWPQFIPTAYPRFHDIYAEAGVQKSLGYIADREGKTYAETLTKALQSRAAVIQLATWNDWGEGTMIEPSVEFGYRDLETTQRLRRKYMSASFPYTAKDLRLPVQLYRLQKQFQDRPAMRARLAAIAQLLFAGRLDRARTLLKTFP